MLCIPAANALLDAAQRSDDAPGEVAALLHLAEVSTSLGDFDSMRAQLQRSRERAVASSDPTLIVEAWSPTVRAERRSAGGAEAARLEAELSQWEGTLTPPGEP